MPIDAVYYFGLRALTRTPRRESNAWTVPRSEGRYPDIERPPGYPGADETELQQIYDELLLRAQESPQRELRHSREFTWEKPGQAQMRKKALADLERLHPARKKPSGTPSSERDEEGDRLLLPAERRAIPAELQSAVAAYRAAGWYERDRHLTDEELVTRLSAMWRELHGGDLLHDPGMLDERLLMLDSARTLHDDIEADVGEGEDVYLDILGSLASRSEGAFGLVPLQEDWGSEPGHVVVRFRINGMDAELRVRDLGDVIDPAVFTGLNALLPHGGPRFYFFDNGGQRFVVTRATPVERARLELTRPVRLAERPPQWWGE